MPEVLFQAFVAGNFHAVTVESQLGENRGVDVGHVVRTFDRVKSELVSGTVSDSALQSAASHQNTETIRMVV